jgi:diketogulonate reductase-like aldo/keto reductase
METWVRTITLPGIDIPIPTLGFGCSALTGVTRKDACKVLGNAFDGGVRHFDVARYYGYGEAEKLLGAFVKGRRREVTIATKFGIQPPRRPSALGLAIQVGRRVVRLVPRMRTFMQSRAKAFIHQRTFSVIEAQTSLETSLRALATDFVDFYLLHDYIADEHSTDDLVRSLEGFVKSGKVRYFGIGTGIDNVLQALEYHPELCRVVQFENSVLIRNVDRLPLGLPSPLVITHGSISTSYISIVSFLRAHGDAVKNWSAELGVDCSNDETIAALMLNCALEMNQNGLVLFSSMSPTRVIKNVKAVLQPTFSAGQIALFSELVEQIARELNP